MEQSDWISIATLIVTATISLTSLVVALRALSISKTTRLFGSFDIASQMSIEFPRLVKAVHGLDENIDDNEAQAVAYLSLLLDGFQHYYDQKDGGDFKNMANELISESTFLNKLLAHPDNQQRWTVIKKAYLAEFDADFTTAIDAIIKHEVSNKNTKSL